MAVLGVPHGDSTGCAFPCPLSPALTGFSCSRRLMVRGAGCRCWVLGERGGRGREEEEGEEGAGCVWAVGDGGGGPDGPG